MTNALMRRTLRSVRAPGASGLCGASFAQTPVRSMLSFGLFLTEENPGRAYPDIAADVARTGALPGPLPRS
jgi:hypothetical protein